jgi:hypothetical protein
VSLRWWGSEPAAERYTTEGTCRPHCGAAPKETPDGPNMMNAAHELD